MSSLNIKGSNLIGNNKTLIILCSHFGTFHSLNQFGANHKSNNLKTFVWNILPLLNKTLFNKFYNKTNDIRIKNKNFTNITSFYQLMRLMLNSKKNFYFTNFARPSILSLTIDLFLCHFKKLKRIEIISNNRIHQGRNYKKVFSRFFKNHKFYLIMKIYLFIYYYIFGKITNFLSKKKESIIFVDNNYVYKKLKKKNGVMVYKYDNEDYSKYLKISKRKIENNYITFLDQGFEHNFEYSLKRIQISQFDAKIYWKNMNNFFFELEKYFNFRYKIVIAAHHRRPRGNYPINRKFYHNKTLDLVRKSRLILGHYSHSLNFPIFFKKPIILLKTDDFDMHSFRRIDEINLLKRQLNLKVFNIDKKLSIDNKNVNDILKVDKKKYEIFFNNFLGFKINKSYGERWKKISSVLYKENS